MKRKIIIISILTVISIALVIISVFAPMVHLVAKDTNPDVVYDKSVSLFTYLFDAPFLSTDASDVYFSASGPIWMATGGLLLCFLSGISGIVLFVLCIIALATIKKQNCALNNNVTAKKIGLFAGYLSLCIGIFETVSYIVTTSMANNYVLFTPTIGSFLLIALGAGIVVLSHLMEKRAQNQTISKTKNSIGFALTGLLSCLTFALAFIPQYLPEFGLEAYSMWDVSKMANALASDPYVANTFGDFTFGIATYLIIASGVVTAFLLVYSIIGFIKSLKNKPANWLSKRIKRWSMTLLIVYILLYCLMLLQAAVIHSTVMVASESLFLIAPYVPALILVPFVTYITSTTVSVNKKIEQKTENTEQTN